MNKKDGTLLVALILFIIILIMLGLSSCMPTKRKYYSRMMQRELDKLEQHDCVLDSLHKELEKL